MSAIEREEVLNFGRHVTLIFVHSSFHSIATLQKAKQPMAAAKARKKVTASAKKRNRCGMTAAVNQALALGKDLL